jgi:hypothetical protein
MTTAQKHSPVCNSVCKPVPVIIERAAARCRTERRVLHHIAEGAR